MIGYSVIPVPILPQFINFIFYHIDRNPIFVGRPRLGALFSQSSLCDVTAGLPSFTPPTPSRPDRSRSQTWSSLPASLNPPPRLCCLRSLPQTPSSHQAQSKFPPRFSPASAASLPFASPRPSRATRRYPNPKSAPTCPLA